MAPPPATVRACSAYSAVQAVHGRAPVACRVAPQRDTTGRITASSHYRRPVPPQAPQFSNVMDVLVLPPAPPHPEQGTQSLPVFLPPLPPHR
jgi:hypothetical protein